MSTRFATYGPLGRRMPLSRHACLAGHHPGSLRGDPENCIRSPIFCKEFSVGKKLYVGNLSYDVTNAVLEELFAPFGSVQSAQVIQDRDTGRSKGFGFVEMSDDNAARSAIQGLHEKDHGGRPLTVNEAKPREDRGPRGGYSRR